MGLLGGSSSFDVDVEKATSENSETEDWAKIMDICDKVGTSSTNAKECLRSIIKRLRHQDPHVVIQAITLLDACVNNCGRNFHLEIASREFETEYRKLLLKYEGPLAQRFKGLLKKWCEGEFKSDPQLNLIPSLMNKLKSERIDFDDASDMPTRKKEASHTSQSSSANIIAMIQKEKDDIDRAIELSLQESKQMSPRNTATSSSASTSLYPTMSQLGSVAPAQEPMKVRALYDFEAAEDNELTFLAGEIIHVSDSSDKNWWKGYNQRGEGLFPANFVTSDLSVDVQNQKTNDRKSVQFSDNIDAKNVEEPTSPNPDEPVEINEGKIDRLISLLHEANPEDSSTDSQEMLYLEGEVNKMGPLIDMELEKIDRKHAHLTQLSKDLVDALDLFHTLMREPPAHMKQPQAAGYRPQMPPHMMYNGSSGYGTMPSMPSYYPQGPQGPVPGPSASGMMGPVSLPGIVPPQHHMGMAPHAHGMMPPQQPPQQSQQQQQQQMMQQQQQQQQHHHQHPSLGGGPMGGGHMNSLPHMSHAPGAPPPTPPHPHSSQQPPSFGPMSQVGGAPIGVYHPSMPGHPPQGLLM